MLINGRKAHRLSDLVQHCGGVGRTVQGSSNVIVGDQGGRHVFTDDRPALRAPLSYLGGFLLQYEDGMPVTGQKYIIRSSNGRIFKGNTDCNGRTERIESDAQDTITIEIIDCYLED